jgi:hypothetical protein
MYNTPVSAAVFINATLHDQLQSFTQTLSKDTAADTVRVLIESLLCALRNGENPTQLSKRIRRERYRKTPTLLPLAATQAVLDIAEIKRLRTLGKAEAFIPGARKLDAYRQEISRLRDSGASQSDIKYWLLANKSVVVSQPTIHRYLQALSDGEKKPK